MNSYISIELKQYCCSSNSKKMTLNFLNIKLVPLYSYIGVPVFSYFILQKFILPFITNQNNIFILYYPQFILIYNRHYDKYNTTAFVPL